MDKKEDILKSLNSLEKSLKGIDSAKRQVEKVTSSVDSLTNVFDEYKESLGDISQSISIILDKSKNYNSSTFKECKANISEISEETERLKNAVSNYTNNLEKEQKKVIDQFALKLNEKIYPIDDDIKKLTLTIQNETIKLKDVLSTYTIDVKEQQNKVVDEFGVELKSKVIPLDQEINRLSSSLREVEAKIKLFKSQIESLPLVDINKGFDIINISIGEFKNNIKELLETLNEASIKRSSFTNDLIDKSINNISKLDSNILLLNNKIECTSEDLGRKLQSVEKNILQDSKFNYSKMESKINQFGIIAIVLFVVDILIRIF